MTKIRPSRAKTNQKVVAIIGGGFGGLNVAKKLASHDEVFVLLIDKKNYHLFQPLLYQVATAGLNPSEIAVPIRSQFANVDNIQVHLAEVDGIKVKEKSVSIGAYDLESDYIIVACGSQHSYFKHPEWEDLAPGLKTLEQATEIRRRILLAFENAENELDQIKQNAMLTFVVVGGGPTGVELAGAIADISRTVLINDFRLIDPARARIVLIEGNDRLLTSFDPALSKKTKEELELLGVEVRTGTYVDGIISTGVETKEGFINAHNVFWAAGVKASSIAFHPEVEKDKAGRIVVTSDFSIPHNPNIFVIGDMASYKIDEASYLPGLAPAAIQAGEYVAQAILNSTNSRERGVFTYSDKGAMATIGKNKAVAEVGSLRLTGRIAWFAWLFVHILYLVGFKNKLTVILQWAWSYIFSKRGARLITDKDWKL